MHHSPHMHDIPWQLFIVTPMHKLFVINTVCIYSHLPMTAMLTTRQNSYVEKSKCILRRSKINCDVIIYSCDDINESNTRAPRPLPDTPRLRKPEYTEVYTIVHPLTNTNTNTKFNILYGSGNFNNVRFHRLIISLHDWGWMGGRRPPPRFPK